MVGGTDLVAVVLQVGFAGYGAFFVAGKVDGDGKTIDEDRFMDGFGIHTGFGYLVMAARPRSSSSSASLPGSGSGGSGRHGVLALLLILQVILAWFGFEVPAIGFFHPVNALAHLRRAVWIVNDTWRGGRTPGHASAEPPAPAAV